MERRPVRIPRIGQARLIFRSGGKGPYVAARHEGGIGQPVVGQRHEGGPVVREMLGLPSKRRRRQHAEKGEVVHQRGLQRGRAAGRIDILQPQQQRAAGFCSHVGVDERAVGVAEVQRTVRTGSEAEYGRRVGLDHDSSYLKLHDSKSG